MSAAWKRHERKTARALGGRRNSRGANFGQSAPDVSHDLFSIECKVRAKLPQLLRIGLEQAASYDQNKVPVLVVRQKHQRGSLVVLKMSDFASLFGGLTEQTEG